MSTKSKKRGNFKYQALEDEDSNDKTAINDDDTRDDTNFDSNHHTPET